MNSSYFDPRFMSLHVFTTIIVSKNVIKRPAETTEEGAATTEAAESAQEASPSSMSPSSS